MERIIVIKREYAPVTMHPEGRGYFINWDYQPSFEDDGTEAGHGTCLSVFAAYRKPTVALAKYLIEDAYNSDTSRKIYDGFKYEGKTVYLTGENQANYTAAYLLASQTDGANLPYVIKAGNEEEGSGYIALRNIDEMKSFYMAMTTYINRCVQDGWAAKDKVDYNAIEKALETIGELPEDLDILTNTL